MGVPSYCLSAGPGRPCNASAKRMSALARATHQGKGSHPYAVAHAYGDLNYSTRQISRHVAGPRAHPPSCCWPDVEGRWSLSNLPRNAQDSWHSAGGVSRTVMQESRAGGMTAHTPPALQRERFANRARRPPESAEQPQRQAGRAARHTVRAGAAGLRVRNNSPSSHAPAALMAPGQSEGPKTPPRRGPAPTAAPAVGLGPEGAWPRTQTNGRETAPPVPQKKAPTARSKRRAAGAGARPLGGARPAPGPPGRGE